MNWALVRQEVLKADGRRERLTTNSKFVHYEEPSIWLPHYSHTDWHTWGTMNGEVVATPLAYEDITVTFLEKRTQPDEAFANLKRPGMFRTALPGNGSPTALCNIRSRRLSHSNGSSMLP